MQYLILGANGYLGSYLFRRMKEEGLQVFGTGHHREGSRDLIYFEIEKDNIEKIISRMSDNNRTAIVCIAEANIDRCYENYGRAYQVNVVCMKNVLQTLQENGFHIIFFSTDNVFSGESGNYTEESATSAINDYGKMKAEMEGYITQNQPGVCILRISKVVGSEHRRQNIFTEWEEMIPNGKIYCIRGNVVSFIYIEDIYQACKIAAERKLGGLYNIVGDISYSRKELAGKFYQAVGKEDMEIVECGLEEFPFRDKRRPLNVSMSNQKFKDETGYLFTSMEQAIAEYTGRTKI